MGIKSFFYRIRGYDKIKSDKNYQDENTVKSDVINQLNAIDQVDLETMETMNQIQSEVNEKGNLLEVMNKMSGYNTNGGNSCGYTEWSPLSIQFFVTNDIPQSYKLISREDYSLQLVVDSHLIKWIQTPEMTNAIILMPNELGEYIEVNGTAQINKISISGSLVYNSILSGFEAVKPMTSQNKVLTNEVGTVFVDRTLGYTTKECSEEENPLGHYSITLIQDPQITVILPDRQEVVLEGSNEFFELIEDNTVQRLLGKKYTLVISGSPEPVS